MGEPVKVPALKPGDFYPVLGPTGWKERPDCRCIYPAVAVAAAAILDRLGTQLPQTFNVEVQQLSRNPRGLQCQTGTAVESSLMDSKATGSWPL